MKRWVKLWFAMSVISMSACTFGNGHICGPQTPAAYCDHDAYEMLTHPKPYLQEWAKPGISLEERRSDSMKCGAGDTDYVGFSRQVQSTQHQGTTDSETDYERLFDWERCMIKMGYRFTGDCSYRKDFPACKH